MFLNSVKGVQKRSADKKKRVVEVVNNPALKGGALREMTGNPQAVTGTEFETVWWYYESDNEIYLLLFKDNVLTSAMVTDASTVSEFIKLNPDYR